MKRCKECGRAESSFEKLNNGTITELIDANLSELVANIADVNTEATAARVLTIKVTIKPQIDRSVGQALVTVTKKLAPDAPETSTVYFGVDENKQPGMSVATYTQIGMKLGGE